MRNKATKFLAEYMYRNQMPVNIISAKLDIPISKMFPDTRECLTAEELLRLCQYLQIRPENIPMDKEIL